MLIKAQSKSQQCKDLLPVSTLQATALATRSYTQSIKLCSWLLPTVWHFDQILTRRVSKELLPFHVWSPQPLCCLMALAVQKPLLRHPHIHRLKHAPRSPFMCSDQPTHQAGRWSRMTLRISKLWWANDKVSEPLEEGIHCSEGGGSQTWSVSAEVISSC